MAVGAGGIGSVVARIGRRLVREDERCPEIAAMAMIALELRYEVAIALAGGRGAIVAARTGPWRYIAMVKVRWYPRVRCVADVALGGRL